MEDIGVGVVMVFYWGEQGCFRHGRAYDVFLFVVAVGVSADVVGPTLLLTKIDQQIESFVRRSSFLPINSNAKVS